MSSLVNNIEMILVVSTIFMIVLSAQTTTSIVVVAFTYGVQGVHPSTFNSKAPPAQKTRKHPQSHPCQLYNSQSHLCSKAPPGGLDFELQEDEEEENSGGMDSTNTDASDSPITAKGTSSVGISMTTDGTTTSSTSSQSITATNNDASEKPQPLPFQNRGKVNEIDFCMSPSDVSLSRSYSSSTTKFSTTATTTATSTARTTTTTTTTASETGSSSPRILSLTRALNNASNRAVRRILLSRSWPSAEALNLSLRQVLIASKENSSSSGSKDDTSTINTVAVDDGSNKTINNNTKKNKEDAKCPVPRPILNIIVRNKNKNGTNKDDDDGGGGDDSDDAPITEFKMNTSSSTPIPLKAKKKDEQWVDDQMRAFRETYGLLPGYEYADAYMECILSLATSGIESDRVVDVIEGGVYDDSYRRLISVLRTAGAVFEGHVGNDDDADKNGSLKSVPRMKIARKLKDQDICLSMLDKISIRNEEIRAMNDESNVSSVDDEMSETVSDESGRSSTEIIATEEEVKEEDDKSVVVKLVDEVEEKKSSKMKDRFSFFMKSMKNRKEDEVEDEIVLKAGESSVVESLPESDDDDDDIEKGINTIKPEDLGAVLLSAEEPTVTRQLNVLSNIVKRALLFGGDQELLVLSETLEADKPAFVQRWYPDVNDDASSVEDRPGVQFFNCLVQLLKDSYTYGVITDLDPPLPLSSSYENSYERLTASLVELGSGYIKPINAKKMTNVLPKTPKEELARFSQWETALRQTKPDITDYPSDFLGSWQVKDEIGGKVIGTSTVIFKPEGEVYVDPPLRGLRWRIDPGPTHLDTCTFQVLSEDGAILQYKGFSDRGARLESRFSRRSIKVRGAVTFQMRDGETASMGEEYKRDMLPIDTITGTTRFVMNKVFDLAIE